VTAILLYGSTEHNPALRHEVPIEIGDELVFAVDDGRSWIQASRLEAKRIAACRPDATLIDDHELGFKELAESGISRAQLELELAARGSPGPGSAARSSTLSFRWRLATGCAPMDFS
jgi:Xaa-Pro aminopeptidase